MRITVKVPQTKTDKWEVSFGSGVRKRNSAATVYNAIKRRLQARVLKEKTTIMAKYGNGHQLKPGKYRCEVSSSHHWMFLGRLPVR